MNEMQLAIRAQCQTCAQMCHGGRNAGLIVETWADGHRREYGHTIQITRISQVVPPAEGVSLPDALESPRLYVQNGPDGVNVPQPGASGEGR